MKLKHILFIAIMFYSLQSVAQKNTSKPAKKSTNTGGDNNNTNNNTKNNRAKKTFIYNTNDAPTKNKPAWLIEKPISENYSYFIGIGEDNSLKNAKQAAVNDVLSQISNAAGVNISAASKTKINNHTFNNDVNTTIDFEAVIVSTGEKIKVTGLRKEDEYYQGRGSRYEYWVLMRKPKKEGIDPNYDMPQTYAASAIWRSALMPGWGQIHKKQKTKGYVLLSSGVLFVAGAFISQNLYSHNYDEAIKNIKHNDSYLYYLDKADNWSTIRNAAFVGAGAIYIYSLIDAIASKGAKRYAYTKPKKYRFYPVYNKNAYQFALGVKF